MCELPLCCPDVREVVSQVSARLKHMRRLNHSTGRSMPLDAWLKRMQNALPSRMQGARPDQAALSVSLQLAAAEERAQAALHQRQDFSDVYLYLAHLANGTVSIAHRCSLRRAAAVYRIVNKYWGAPVPSPKNELLRIAIVFLYLLSLVSG